MGPRLKFYGWGYENTGLDDAEREQLFRFVADRLGVEPRLSPPPQASEIALRAPRVAAPAALAGVLTPDPYERLLHTYGKSFPETVRAFAHDFTSAPDLVALPASEADVAAVLDWASGAKVAIIPFGCGSSVVGGVEPAVGDSYAGAVQPRYASPRPRARGRRDQSRGADRSRHPRPGDRSGAEAPRLRHPALSAEL